MNAIASDTSDDRPVKCPVCGHEFVPKAEPLLGRNLCPKCHSLFEFFPGKDAVICNASTRWKYKSRAELEAAGEWNETERKVAPGKRVWVTGGTFENFEGTVASIDEAKQEAIVEFDVFGRMVSVSLKFAELEVFG